MARTDPQLNFRCPASLKDRLEAAAAASGRSVTQEIIARLQASFDAPDVESLHAQLHMERMRTIVLALSLSKIADSTDLKALAKTNPQVVKGVQAAKSFEAEFIAGGGLDRLLRDAVKEVG